MGRLRGVEEGHVHLVLCVAIDYIYTTLLCYLEHFYHVPNTEYYLKTRPFSI
jgi:hypothetical protein